MDDITKNNNMTPAEQASSADFMQGHDAPPSTPKTNPIVAMGMRYNK